jgi:hypothetical protein
MVICSKIDAFRAGVYNRGNLKGSVKIEQTFFKRRLFKGYYYESAS